MLHEFVLDIPEGMPIYLQEHLYEHLCNEHYNKGVSLEQVLEDGRQTIEEFTTRFPVFSKSKEEIVITDFVPRPEYPDGTIIFRVDDKKFIGYFANRAVSKASSIEAVQKFMTKKYGITTFTINELAAGQV